MRPVRPPLALFALIFCGCASLADVKPGDGMRMEVEASSYTAIWAAALKVADESFVIREDNPATGVILAERVKHAWPWREYVGIFISPPAAGAERYTLEVVSRRPTSRRKWEDRILGEIRRELPMP